ncbi:hypothetical protein [Laspinema palackyanum]|uniref:hypothetical protein n=1 Tax=Laspinema palackyanum TaxID=3231601 RepID=UPI00345D8892|nr:hypothetical protein [Laspinema sp. D2c]
MIKSRLNSLSDNKILIALLLGAPFTEQNYERIGIPYLKHKFNVVVLDCNTWLRSGFSELKFSEYDYPYLIKISSAKEFIDVISQIKPNYAIDFLGLGRYTRFIQETLKIYGVKFVVQKTGALPAPSKKNRIIQGLIKNPKNLIFQLMNKLVMSRKENRPLPPDISLLAGAKTRDYWTNQSKNILWIASRDYYSYKKVNSESKNNNLLALGDYILFIDDAITVASDIKLLGISPAMKPEDYYNLLLQAFNNIEKLVGLPVVIAAHPSTKSLNQYESFFGDRNVYFGITPELCCHSSLVLSHISTALSYAILWDKPIIILTSKELDRSSWGVEMREWNIQLNCPLLFMEASQKQYTDAYQKSKNIDKNKYKLYINNYIKTDEVVEEEPWEEFSRFIQKNNYF